jgi:hypothetical protein
VSVASPGRFEWKIRHLMIPFARFIDRLGGLRI